MSASSPLLDYASPRPRSRARLPSVSLIAFRGDRDSCDVFERLSGKYSATLALLFAGALVVGIPLIVQSDGELLRGELLVWGVMEAALIIVSVLVIRNTWRQTRLHANADGVTVTFTAPLARKHSVHYAPGELSTIQLAMLDPVNALAELRIIPVHGRPIYLFTDHPQRELATLANAVGAILGVVLTE